MSPIVTIKCSLFHRSCGKRLLQFVIFLFMIKCVPMLSAYIIRGENNDTELRLQSMSFAIRYRSLSYEETLTTALHL